MQKNERNGDLRNDKEMIDKNYEEMKK